MPWKMLDFTVLFENHTAMYIAKITIQHIYIAIPVFSITMKTP